MVGMLSLPLLLLVATGSALAHPFDHDHHDELPNDPSVNTQYYLPKPQYLKIDDPPYALPKGMEASYHGLVTYAGTKPTRCFGMDSEVTFDVAVIGAPFDTSTSWRPGARFGPNGIRQGSQRISGGWGYNTELKVNAFEELEIVDCGDVPMSFFDNTAALNSLTKAYKSLINRPVHSTKLRQGRPKNTKTGRHHPRIITLGGDHSVLLPILRGVAGVYGPISVIHFDSHMDTWSPMAEDTVYAQLNHGTMLHHAAQEGLIANGTSVHLGLRSPLRGPEDYEHDSEMGFVRVEAWEIDKIGTAGIIQRVKDVVGEKPVYLSIDIDVLDPSIAPATGTPEIGGWTTREMKTILQGIKDLNIVGADVVEVAPSYDNQAELTQIAAANLIYQILGGFAASTLEV